MRVPTFIFAAIFFICSANGADNRCNAKTGSIRPSNCANQLAAQTASLQSYLSILGGAALAGAGFLLASSANGSHETPPSPPRAATMTGQVGYVDPAALSEVLNNADYRKNFNDYNEIRLAYSLARGWTGKGTAVAVLEETPAGWHATAVSGLVAAIAPDAQVNSYKINFSSYGDIGNTIRGANERIFNNSWGIPTADGNTNAASIKNRSQLIYWTDANFINAVSAAATERDAIFVWAAGNNGTAQPQALSAMPLIMPELNGHFINVVAWDTEAGRLASWSNQCGITMNYCLTAPGNRIDINIGTASGTSFATPMVSGAVAVLEEMFPYMRAEEISALLFTTARDLGVAGIDEVYGRGMLDLEAATRPVGAPMVPIDSAVGGQAAPLGNMSMSAALGNKLRAANLEVMFVDSFQRGFNTKLNQHLKIVPDSRQLQRFIREDRMFSLSQNFQFGFNFQNDMLLPSENQITFNSIFQNKIGIFTQRLEIGLAHPQLSPDSLIGSVSNLTTASWQLGAEWRNFQFAIRRPTMIISGEMNARLPVARIGDKYEFANYKIDLRGAPALEYWTEYKGAALMFSNAGEIAMMMKFRIDF